MFFNILLLSITLIGLSLLGLALNILIKKDGKFPTYRVGHNSEMAKRGIKCVKQEEIRCHKASLKELEKECHGCQQLT
ncbi:MAG: hypothetical protein K9J30_01480 [Bacteroidales bacterium]|nr:hypothetical protein [Bacteroidales bacterium]